MIPRNRPPVHPGGILKRHYLEPLALSVSQAAADLGVSRKTVSKVVNGRGDVTPEMALRLSRAFHTTPEFWLNLQRNYDLWIAQRSRAWRSARAVRAASPAKESRKPRTYHDLDDFFGSWVHDATTEAALRDQRAACVDVVRPPGSPCVLTASFTAVYQKREKWYIGFVEEIPGVNTQGKTLAEVKRNLKEALGLVLKTNRDLAHKSHPKSAIEEPISVRLA